MAAPKRKKPVEETPKSPWTVADLDAVAEKGRRFFDRLDRLTRNPPQVLLIEGGTLREREAAALHYAAGLACPAKPELGGPCLACPACGRMLAFAHEDLVWFDGAAGLIASDSIKEAKPTFGEAPRGDGLRSVVFFEAWNMAPGISNTLLKTLEEPNVHTRFVLAVAQRERLLPTLVSRSFVLTLPWPRKSMQAKENPHRVFVEERVARLYGFFHSGLGWFGRSDKYDKSQAGALVNALKREIAAVYVGAGGGEIAGEFRAGFGIPELRAVEAACDQCLEALDYNVNPSLVVDALAAQIHTRLHSRRAGRTVNAGR